MHAQRRGAGRSLLGILIFSLIPAQAVASDTAVPDNNYYGFMVYDWDAPLEDALPAIFSLGARWIHAEGPNQLSKSVHWGQVQPYSENPDCYDFETVSWIRDAASQGFDVLLTLSTGHDSPNWWFQNTFSPWVECHEELNSCSGGFQAVGFASNCPPAEDHWQQWYDFV